MALKFTNDLAKSIIKEKTGSEEYDYFILSVERKPFWALANGLLGALFMKQILLVKSGSDYHFINMNAFYKPFGYSHCLETDIVSCKYKKFGMNNFIDFLVQGNKPIKIAVSKFCAKSGDGVLETVIEFAKSKKG